MTDYPHLLSPITIGPLTLRNRLILSIVAIVVLLTVVIGTVSVVALRGSLMRQLDDDLASATGRAVAAASIGGSSGRLRRTQTGFVRSYALTMLGGSIVLVAALLAVSAQGGM